MDNHEVAPRVTRTLGCMTRAQHFGQAQATPAAFLATLPSRQVFFLSMRMGAAPFQAALAPAARLFFCRARLPRNPQRSRSPAWLPFVSPVSRGVGENLP